MQFTIEYLEYFILIVVRVSAIVYITPFFGQSDIPRRVQAGITIFLSIMIATMLDFTGLSYDGMMGYLMLVVKEAITGLLIGIGSGFCLYILNFAGNMVDMEIGFAMAMEYDPATQVQTTITSSLFTTVFLLIFMVSDMHYFVVDAMIDSYTLLPIGSAQLPSSLLEVFTVYMADYFVIGFRIILPIFSVILVINVVLGILAKVAPQMNMFVIGMQLKVLVGFFLLFIVMGMFSGVVDIVFEEMQKLTKDFLDVMAAGS